MQYFSHRKKHHTNIETFEPQDFVLGLLHVHLKLTGIEFSQIFKYNVYALT